ENEINQRKFRSEYQKARINIIYTYNWLWEKVSSMLEGTDITPQQFNILRILRGEGQALSTMQIRRRMLDKMSDTSRIVDRLVKKGLVKKTANAEDRRLVDVVITPKGKKLLEKIDPIEESADQFMTSLSQEETATLNGLLDKLRNAAPVLLLILGLLCSLLGRTQEVVTPAEAPPKAPVVLPIFPTADLPPTKPKYEFRAAWIASVENIDWPSKKGLPADSQKAEFIRQLEMHKRNGMNAVVVQIRPAADAFYPSSFEPWSEWLTGVQGKAPSPWYDPLQFMIDETHKRGMEFHAWCNPYRAVKTIGKSSIAPDHVTKRHPEWFVRFEGTLYFDPGNKDVQQYVVSVIRDIVKRYDIDALHFDDYFYPYDIVEGSVAHDFPDKATFKKYGGDLSISDWRRSNVDSVILALSKAIKEEKPLVKFGISPFGVWRNKNKDPEGSETMAGQTNYDNLYANILLWLKNGWIDYVVPQLYWEFTFAHAPYGVLVDWWSRHSYGRQCYIGVGIFKAGYNAAWRNPKELTRQIQVMRSYPEISGAVYFSSTSFNKNPYGWNDSLKNNYYSYPALIEPMPWIDSTRPHEPVFRTEYNQKELSGTAWLTKGAPEDKLRGYAIYRTDSAGVALDNLPAFEFVPYDAVAGFTVHSGKAEEKGKIFYYYVTAVSKTNVESKAVPLLFSNFTAGLGAAQPHN
ncbi:MAG: family 10 glycosylhydrolase, partial [Bacteroidetes bacterium]|nr:family 10 glycosylhydrolase [Bacteroidota bacterium]